MQSGTVSINEECMRGVCTIQNRVIILLKYKKLLELVD